MKRPRDRATPPPSATSGSATSAGWGSHTAGRRLCGGTWRRPSREMPWHSSTSGCVTSGGTAWSAIGRARWNGTTQPRSRATPSPKRTSGASTGPLLRRTGRSQRPGTGMRPSKAILPRSIFLRSFARGARRGLTRTPPPPPCGIGRPRSRAMRTHSAAWAHATNTASACRPAAGRRSGGTVLQPTRISRAPCCGSASATAAARGWWPTARKPWNTSPGLPTAGAPGHCASLGRCTSKVSRARGGTSGGRWSATAARPSSTAPRRATLSGAWRLPGRAWPRTPRGRWSGGGPRRLAATRGPPTAWRSATSRGRGAR
mmetsp:Transcript_29067/g.92774  ORF Transcript_29067/g.92774 Transcript_29067/m.92774 type:complete len:316 (+) Transcript_29067:949-1896(+)